MSNYFNILLNRHYSNPNKSTPVLPTVQPRLRSRFENGSRNHPVGETLTSEDIQGIQDDFEKPVTHTPDRPIRQSQQNLSASDELSSDQSSANIHVPQARFSKPQAAPDSLTMPKQFDGPGSLTHGEQTTSADVESLSGENQAGSPKRESDGAVASKQGLHRNLSPGPSRDIRQRIASFRSGRPQSAESSLFETEQINSLANNAEADSADPNITPRINPSGNKDITDGSGQTGILRLSGQLPKIPVEASASSPQSAAAGEPIVNITIGRVEVKASDSAVRQAPAAARKSPEIMTLAEYLGKRDRDLA